MQRVLSVSPTEARHTFQRIIICNFLQVVRAHLTQTRTSRCEQREILRLLIPHSHRIVTMPRHLKFQRFHALNMFRMKSGETHAAFVACEVHETPHDILHIVHGLQRLLAQLQVQACGAQGNKLLREDLAVSRQHA